MKLTHEISGVRKVISWEQLDIIDIHDSGCVEWLVAGTDEDGVEYFGCATYQDDELIEVINIEEE